MLEIHHSGREPLNTHGGRTNTGNALSTQYTINVISTQESRFQSTIQLMSYEHGKRTVDTIQQMSNTQTTSTQSTIHIILSKCTPYNRTQNRYHHMTNNVLNNVLQDQDNQKSKMFTHLLPSFSAVKHPITSPPPPPTPCSPLFSLLKTLWQQRLANNCPKTAHSSPLRQETGPKDTAVRPVKCFAENSFCSSDRHHPAAFDVKEREVSGYRNHTFHQALHTYQSRSCLSFLVTPFLSFPFASILSLLLDSQSCEQPT